MAGQAVQADWIGAGVGQCQLGLAEQQYLRAAVEPGGDCPQTHAV